MMSVFHAQFLRIEFMQLYLSGEANAKNVLHDMSPQSDKATIQLASRAPEELGVFGHVRHPLALIRAHSIIHHLNLWSGFGRGSQLDIRKDVTATK
jgi:hypothetical protein